MLFDTASWVGISYAHVVLAVTDKNQCWVESGYYLTKDFNTTLEDLTDQGWRIIEQDNQSYLLQKDNKYRRVALRERTITGYDFVMIGDEFDDISKRRIPFPLEE